MNILVTGGAGFIGSHLVEELVKDKENKVTVLDDLSTGKIENLSHIPQDKVDGWSGDICSEIQFPHDLEYNFDAVYHLAAKRSVPLSFEIPYEFFRVNINGTWNMLEKNKKARFVNISSSSAPECLSPYGITKRTAEHLTALHPNGVSLRLFNVFGERQSDCGAIVPEFTKLMLKGKQPTIYGDGLQTRDFTYVKDVVDELIKFGQGKHRRITGANEVGYGSPIMVTELFHRIAKLTNYKKGIINAPAREGDIRNSKCWNPIEIPQYGFEEGLKRTVKWIKEMKPYEVNL